jgi:hypothetical protein
LEGGKPVEVFYSPRTNDQYNASPMACASYGNVEPEAESHPKSGGGMSYSDVFDTGGAMRGAMFSAGECCAHRGFCTKTFVAAWLV